jgi:hypothetical protein
MSFRGSQIYVQGQTRYRLSLLARVLPAHRMTGPVGGGSYTPPPPKTADELADELLNEAMLTKYPPLAQLEAQIKVLEEAAANAIREGAK